MAYLESTNIVLLAFSPVCVIVLFLSAYCILWNSPRFMTSLYRTYLFLQCFLTSLFILCVSAGTQPVILTPCLAGYTKGVFNLLNMSTVTQIGIQVSLLCYVLGVTIIFLHDQYISLISTNHKKTFTLGRISLYTFIFTSFFILPTVLSFLLEVENQIENRKICRKTYVGKAYVLYCPKTVFLSFSTAGVTCTVYLIVLTILLIISTVAILTFNCLIQKNLMESKLKISTELQSKRVFLVNILSIQTILQGICFGVPILLFVIFTFFNLNISNGYNICNTLICLQLLAPLRILYIVPSYKRAIYAIFPVVPENVRPRMKISRSVSSKNEVCLF